MFIHGIKSILAVVVTSAILSSCSSFTPAPQMTSLQIQAMQSREVSTTKKIAFASVMTVFQNFGYIISSAEYDTGFITAESPSESGGWFASSERTKVTAFIQQVNDNTARIRLNFVSRVEYDSQQNVIIRDYAIMDPATYQKAFNQIQEEIFISSPFPSKTNTNNSKISNHPSVYN